MAGPARGLLTAAALPAANAVQGVSLATGFTDFQTWSLFGSATAQNTTPGNGFTYSSLQLTTTGSGGRAGAGFAPSTLTLDFNQSFHFDFHFFIPVSTGVRGDGLTFTLSDTANVGSDGSGLGYEGLPESVAFAVDTFDFGAPEPQSPSLQILQSGSVTPLAFTETGLGDSIRDPDFQFLATVDYVPSGLNDDSGQLTGAIFHPNLGTFSVTAPVDFTTTGLVGMPIHYGFTASNGLATDGHFITSAVAVPEPASVALLLAGLGVVAGAARRRATTA